MVHENITMASHGHDVLHQITTPNVCMTEDGAVVSGGIIHFLLIHPYSTYSFSIRTWSVARRRQLSVFCHHEDALECLPRLSAALHIAAVHEVTASKKAPHAQSSSRLGLQSTSPAASFQQSFYKGVSLYSIMSPIGSHRRILFTGNLLDTVQFQRHSAQSLRRA
jgi:hypothetical protein